MPDLRQTRKDIKTSLAIMVAVDVVAVAVLISPLVGSTDSRRGTQPVVERTANQDAAG